MRFVLLIALVVYAVATADAQPWTDPDSSKFRVRNVTEINSVDDDYAPCITPSREWLYFTSSRDGGVAKVHRAPRNGTGWGRPTLVTDSILGDSLGDDGALAITFPILAQLFPLTARDLKELSFVGLGTFTSGRRPGQYADADLYLVRVGLNQVDLAERNPIPAINTDNWEAQGAITPDGKILVFSSDREGGFGGMDLWISARNREGDFSPPVNVGSVLNTEGNEFSPSFSPDGTTLYFASTGHGGSGGSDIFMTRLDMTSGRFSPPENIGPRVNTSSNESFFVSTGRDRCLFVSDRPGGSGGLDIYEGTPNIFAGNYTSVSITLIDTTLRRNLRGHIRVVEPLLGRTIQEFDVEPGVPAVIPLPGGIDYRIEAQVPGFDSTFSVISNLPPDTTYRHTVTFGTPPPAPEVVFTIDGVDVPLFVSGYYRINTFVSLKELRQRQEGDLKRLTYIENVARDTSVFEAYTARAERVEKILDDFYTRCVTQYFPGYLRVKSPEEKLEVYVYGYADPRPILGRYQEKNITFYDSLGGRHQVAKGEKLDNFKLAGLRAVYAVQYLDARFRNAATEGHQEYKELLDAGSIRWIPVSGNVDDYSGGDDLAQKRRIKLVFKRTQP